MADVPQGQPAPQPEPSVSDLARALQQEFQALRQQQAATQQQLQALAQQRQQEAVAKKTPTASDFAVLRENFHAQWDANPLRAAAELQSGAAEIALQKARAEFGEELKRRDAAQQAEQYRNWVLQQNPDIAPRWTQVESYVGWAQANRPDLNFDQQVQLAVQATRDTMQKERDEWLRTATEEQRQRALVSMPTGGAFGSGPTAPENLDEAESRQRRYEMLLARSSKAMRGAYRTPTAAAAS